MAASHSGRKISGVVQDADIRCRDAAVARPDHCPDRSLRERLAMDAEDKKTERELTAEILERVRRIAELRVSRSLSVLGSQPWATAAPCTSATACLRCARSSSGSGWPG